MKAPAILPVSPTPLARPDAVVFDCDGVLVDSEPITCGVLAEMLVELGLDFDVDRTIKTFMGKSVKDEMTAIEAMIGRKLEADWHPQFCRRRDAALAVRVEEVAGVRAVVERLAQLGIPFAVASGADRAKMRLTLGTCGLLPHFEAQHVRLRHGPAAQAGARRLPAGDEDAGRRPQAHRSSSRTRRPAREPASLPARVVYGLTTLNPPAALMEAGASLTFEHMDQLPALLRLDRACLLPDSGNGILDGHGSGPAGIGRFRLDGDRDPPERDPLRPQRRRSVAGSWPW